MNLIVADQRLPQGVASTLRWTCVDEKGAPVAASDAVTVSVARADGTVVVTDAATTEDPDTTGLYTKGLTVAQMASLDVLTATWAVGGVDVATTIVEVVGRFYFSLQDIRLAHRAHTDTALYPDDLLVKYRDIAERECEYICDRAFVPRFRRITVDGPGERELAVPNNDLRTVTACSVDDTALTVDELAALKVYQHRRIEQPVGSAWWWGQENVTIAYTYGLDSPPGEVKEMALIRCGEMMRMAKVGGPNATATRMSVDGTTLDLATASQYSTGNPEVDAIYARWSLRGSATKAGVTLAPASVSMDLNPTIDYLFHGGRR